MQNSESELNVNQVKPACQSDRCLERAATCAASEANVLITGETGTGKGLLAWAIHNNSSRRDEGYVHVDCASLKSDLIEDTLFGHVKGAYTGASRDFQGRVALAHKGTLFLDEIGELGPEVQKRILQLLENKSFYPLGSKEPVATDFRLISATNRDLEREVEQGNFRMDLYYRICGRVLHVPPLRERKGDIRELTFYHTEKICTRLGLAQKKIYPEFLEALTAFDWPGNVRELQNVLGDAIDTFPQDRNLQPSHLPGRVRIALHKTGAGPAQGQPDEPSPSFGARLPFQGELPTWKELRQDVLDSLEKRYFQELAEQTGGQVKEMARISGLSQARIYELFKKHPSLVSS